MTVKRMTFILYFMASSILACFSCATGFAEAGKVQGSHIKNPLNYGAKGDGKEDDTRALLLLARDLKDGDVVVFPPQRVFLVSHWGGRDKVALPSFKNNYSASRYGTSVFPITGKNNIKIFGKGSTITLKDEYSKNIAGVPIALFSVEKSSNITLSGFNLDGNRKNEYSYVFGVFAQDSNLKIEDFTTRNLKVGFAPQANVSAVVAKNHFNEADGGTLVNDDNVQRRGMLSNDFAIYAPDSPNLELIIENNSFGPTNRDAIEIDCQGITKKWGGWGRVEPGMLRKKIMIRKNTFKDVQEMQDVGGSFGLAIGIASRENVEIVDNNFLNVTVAVHLESQIINNDKDDLSSRSYIKNVEISNNRIEKAKIGLRLFGDPKHSDAINGSDVTIKNNDIYNVAEGILVVNGWRNVLVSHNLVDNTSYRNGDGKAGIYLKHVEDYLVADNTVINFKDRSYLFPDSRGRKQGNIQK